MYQWCKQASHPKQECMPFNNMSLTVKLYTKLLCLADKFQTRKALTCFQYINVRCYYYQRPLSFSFASRYHFHFECVFYHQLKIKQRISFIQKLYCYPLVLESFYNCFHWCLIWMTMIVCEAFINDLIFYFPTETDKNVQSQCQKFGSVQQAHAIVISIKIKLTSTATRKQQK